MTEKENEDLIASAIYSVNSAQKLQQLFNAVTMQRLLDSFGHKCSVGGLFKTLFSSE